jgi:hypothetical protein
MEVMHERVAGLDVHKATVAACVRIMSGGKVPRECRTFSTATDGLEALLAWLSARGPGGTDRERRRTSGFQIGKLCAFCHSHVPLGNTAAKGHE